MSDLISEVYNLLKKSKKVVYFNSSKTELITRCPYCGDSEDASHAHLYIATVPPFKMSCMRCNTAGLLNARRLEDLSVDDGELGIQLNKSISRSIKNSTKTDGDSILSFFGKKKTLLDYNVDSPRYMRKVAYLEERFGREITPDNLKDLKVIIDVIKFLTHNNCKNSIEYYSQYETRTNYIKKVNANSVGFLSADTNYINFRHIKPLAFKEGDTPRRYFMENLNRPFDMGSKVYYVGNNLDILTPTLNVKMTEGVFDIASVFMNLFDGQKSSDTIFVSANGKTFNQPILNLRKMGFLSINLDIYSDGDVPLNKYKHMLNFDLFEKINIHYNIKEDQKDFGVKKSLIKEKLYRLK